MADVWDGVDLRGSFGQWKACKGTKQVIYSFGGWTWSGGFGQAAANATAFANSCYNLVNGVGTAAPWGGTFNGIDLDWEYPNACGLSCDASGFAAFRTLMSAVRSRFSGQIVSAAITADGTPGGKLEKADYAGAASSVDYYLMMTYDYFGAWAPSGPTAPHAPGCGYTGIPIAGFEAATTIAKAKSLGIAGSKMLMGIGAYGRCWTGVTQSAPGGSATGAAPGTYEPGIEDYYVLASRPNTGTVANTSYSFSAPNWCGFDRPTHVTAKRSWAGGQGLGGMFMWELSGDRSSALLSAW